MGRFMRETLSVGKCWEPTLSQRGQRTLRKTVGLPPPIPIPGAEACRRLHNPAAIAAPSCCFVPDTSRLLACSTADGEWRIGTSTRGPGKCTSCLQVGLPEQEDLPSDGIASIPGNFNAARICGSEPTDSGRELRTELVVVAEPCICKRLLPELFTPN